MTTIPHQRLALASGSFGTDQTVNHMAKIAMGQYGAGSMTIRMLAIKIVTDANVTEKDVRGEIDAIHVWVQSHLRYVRDPVGVELITYPETLLQVKHGDCDDHVILEAALLGALGIPTRFVTIGTGPSGMNHVYMEALIQREKTWIPLDPIMKNKPPGWFAPNPRRIKRYPMNSAEGLGVGGAVNIAFMALAGYLGRKALTRLGWWA